MEKFGPAKWFFSCPIYMSKKHKAPRLRDTFLSDALSLHELIYIQVSAVKKRAINGLFFAVLSGKTAASNDAAPSCEVPKSAA